VVTVVKLLVEEIMEEVREDQDTDNRLLEDQEVMEEQQLEELLEGKLRTKSCICQSFQ